MRIPPEEHVAPEYVAARRVLLDALTALRPHLHNLVLVGAQAVYHHTGSSGINVALMTTDGDLAINTDGLAAAPEIGTALRVAGFTAGSNPGHWLSVSDVAIDLMVVPHQAGTARASARAARLPDHDRRAARITRGLEPALLDNDVVVIEALEPNDTRSAPLRVAGPAALLAAKAIKISERLQAAEIQPDRVKEKDALDAFRILQAVDTAELARGIARHRIDDYAAAVTDEALEIYRLHASVPDGRIAQLAALASLGDPTVAPAFAALVSDLLAAT